MHSLGMNTQINLKNTVQVLLLHSEARHNLVYLSNDCAKKGGCREKQKDAIYLQANYQSKSS